MRSIWAQAFVVVALIGGSLGAFGLHQDGAANAMLGAALACAPGLFAAAKPSKL